MTAARSCPECGADLPADAPEGLCPPCLLAQAVGGAAGVSRDDGGQTAAYQPPSAAPELADLARHFPGLEILGEVGRGGMGVVYKARQPDLDRLVALKVLPPEAGRDPAFAERFTQEARALARLTHPNIIAVYDFGRSGDLCYLIMEFVDGVNLRQLLGAGRLGPDQALAIVPQICEALQYAHGEGVVHRDIKPENLLLDRKGRVKVADFGLAKLLGPAPADGRLTGSRQVMGTLHYMAPEQVETPLQVDHRADIYSLGVVFYELLTGELPLGRFAPPSAKAPVDVRLDQVVFRALEKELSRRYQQASEVKTDLEAITAHVPARGSGAVAARPLLERVAEADRRQVIPPAVGLLLAGALACMQAAVLCLLAPQFAPFVPRWRWIDPCLVLLGPLTGVIIFRGALKMLRLE